MGVFWILDSWDLRPQLLLGISLPDNFLLQVLGFSFLTSEKVTKEDRERDYALITAEIDSLLFINRLGNRRSRSKTSKCPILHGSVSRLKKEVWWGRRLFVAEDNGEMEEREGISWSALPFGALLFKQRSPDCRRSYWVGRVSEKSVHKWEQMIWLSFQEKGKQLRVQCCHKERERETGGEGEEGSWLFTLHSSLFSLWKS